MLCKVDTAFNLPWSNYTTFNISQQMSGGLLVMSDGTNNRYTIDWENREVEVILTLTETGFGDPVNYSFYGGNNTVLTKIGTIEKSSWQIQNTYKSDVSNTYRIINTSTSSSSTYTKWTALFRHRFYKTIFSYKKIKVYDVKSIWQKINSYLFGILPTGERRDGN